MNLSVIAFGVMAGFGILFVAAIFLMERSSSRVDFSKQDTTDIKDENPFEPSN
jgi:hypothetical protein